MGIFLGSRWQHMPPEHNYFIKFDLFNFNNYMLQCLLGICSWVSVENKYFEFLLLFQQLYPVARAAIWILAIWKIPITVTFLMSFQCIGAPKMNFL